MKINIINMNLVVFVLIFIFCNFANAQDKPPSILAIEVAYTHLEKEISDIKYPDVPYAKQKSNPENYSIGFSFDTRNYYIIFMPKLEGFDLEGGSVTYTISKTNLKILDVYWNK